MVIHANFHAEEQLFLEETKMRNLKNFIDNFFFERLIQISHLLLNVVAVEKKPVVGTF